MQKRIEKIQSLLKQKSASAFFITNQKNILYLTGFIGISPTDRESSLLITEKRTYLFVPKMYEQRAKTHCFATQRNFTDENFEIVVDHERYGLLTSFSQFVTEEDIILIEAQNLTLSEFEKIETVSRAQFVKEKFLIENFRMVKDQEEIELLQKACEITDNVYNEIVLFLQTTDVTTITEMDIAHFMRKSGQNFGADGFGFEPIIASGRGAAEPHYFTSSTKFLQKNSCLLLDFGFAFGGYTADLSRNIYLGKAHEEYKKIFKLVQECQKECIKACKAGLKTHGIFDISYNFFKKHNVEKNYLHSLGHGVGLDVHESPSLGASQEKILEENMVITIEPGLYFENSFGVRIEDVVVVKNDGVEVLSKNSSRELVEIL